MKTEVRILILLLGLVLLLLGYVALHKPKSLQDQIEDQCSTVTVVSHDQCVDDLTKFYLGGGR